MGWTRSAWLWVAFLALLMACGGAFEGHQTGSLVRLPWPDASGDYQFRDVPLITLSLPSALSGVAARVRWQSGKPVYPRIVRSERVWIPLDAVSVQALSAYGVMERLRSFDQQLGVGDRLSWPRELIFDARYRTTSGTMFNNAIYDAGLDLIAIAPFSGATMPIVLNHGILAHEHFHAHFAKFWRERVQRTVEPAEQDRQRANLAVVAGWNEGLADFYAFVFSGDARFMRHTFPAQVGFRHLNGPTYPLITRTRIAANLKDDFSYVNGTALARWLADWSVAIDKTTGARKVLSEVMRSLPSILAEAGALHTKGEAIHPGLIVVGLLRQMNLAKPALVCNSARELLAEERERFEMLDGCP